MAKSRETLESDLQNMLGILNQTRDQLEQFRTQAELLRISVEEHKTAVETLEAYKDLKKGEEVLVPVGANVFIHAHSTGSKVAITELGAGISAELPIEAAVEKLRKRVEKIEASRKKVVEGGQRLEASADSLEQQIQMAYGELSAAEAGASARGHPGRKGPASGPEE